MQYLKKLKTEKLPAPTKYKGNFGKQENLTAYFDYATLSVVVGNEHGDTSSNPGRDWLHFI